MVSERGGEGAGSSGGRRGLGQGRGGAVREVGGAPGPAPAPKSKAGRPHFREAGPVPDDTLNPREVPVPSLEACPPGR